MRSIYSATPNRCGSLFTFARSQTQDQFVNEPHLQFYPPRIR